jgi:dihydrofolate reductase
MRRIRYSVAMSLDGYIAGPKGEADWIVMDPEIDFAALMNQFDTVLVGRKTFQTMVNAGPSTIPGMKIFIFSRTLQQSDYPEGTIVAEKTEDIVAKLKKSPGKDIWLFGGGSLFRSLADAGLVDTIEVVVEPVILGAGIPLAPGAHQSKLKLSSHKVYKTGIVSLTYAIGSGEARARQIQF